MPSRLPHTTNTTNFAEELPAVDQHGSIESAAQLNTRWGEPRVQERLVGGAMSFLIHLILILLL